MEMNQEVAPFLLSTEKDVKPETPHLRLEIALGAELREDSYCTILANIICTISDYPHDSPYIISWDQEDAYAVMLLFQHTPAGLFQIEVDADLAITAGVENSTRNDRGLQTPFKVDQYSSRPVHELSARGRASFMLSMPKRFRDKLVVGRKYELVWPGGEIALCKWGTKKECWGLELNRNEPMICLPATSATIEFNKFGPERKEKEESPPPIAPSEIIPGAPQISVTLEGDKSIPQNGAWTLNVTALYDAPAGSSPIMFHTLPILSWYGPHEGHELYRRRANANVWETIDDDTQGFMIVDEPDVFVNVVQNKDFESLQPGKTWSIALCFRDAAFGDSPMEVGDVFRCTFKGVEVDWWDWGDREAHVDTVVKLPCFLRGQVIEPKDNGGRSKLIIPASNSLEFTVVRAIYVIPILNIRLTNSQSSTVTSHQSI